MDVQVRVIDCSIGGVALHITTITGALVTELSACVKPLELVKSKVKWPSIVWLQLWLCRSVHKNIVNSIVRE